MGRPEAPPACDLAALGASRGRHRRLLGALLGAASRVEETAHGWRLELPAEGRAFRAAAAWVALERRCCPFVAFRLAWGRDGRVTLAAVAADAAGGEALREGLRAVAGEAAARGDARRQP